VTSANQILQGVRRQTNITSDPAHFTIEDTHNKQV